MSFFLWGIYPYLTVTIMVVGSLYRFKYNKISWTSKSSEILEKKLLRYGSMGFHWGLFFVFGGHVMGLLIPIRVYNSMGISLELYHFVADLFGGIAGLICWLGLLLLLIRRITNRRVRINSSTGDFVALIMLFIVITLGAAVTIGYNNIYGPYDYLHTVSPWVRGLLLLHPDVHLMASVPVLLKVHIFFAFALFVTVPFTRLVHFWSLPLGYLTRSPILYRSRTRYGNSTYRH